MKNSIAEIHFRLHAPGRVPGDIVRSDAPSSGGGRLPRVTQVMALAIHFQDMIREGSPRITPIWRGSVV